MFKKHIPALDGLRGFAAFWVVLSHLDEVGLPEVVPGQTGEYGVFLFFILSGFLMGHLYLRKDFTLQNTLGYAIARAARIVPIYYLVIIACTLLSLWLGDRFIYYMSAKDTVRHLLFVGNKYVFWSIGPEVQFYFLFVGLWWLSDRLKRGATSALPIAILAAGLVLFVQPFVPGTLVFSKFHIFLAGVAMAAAATRLPDAQYLSKSAAVWGVQFAAIGLIVALTFTPYLHTTLLNPNHLPHDISFNTIYGDYRWLILMSVILFVIAVDTPVSRFLFANPIGRLAGNYSFSVYLLHVPVMMGSRNLVAPLHLSPAAQVIVALAATVAIGPVCYLLVEKPSQNWFRAKLGAVAAALVARQAKVGSETDLATARTTG